MKGHIYCLFTEFGLSQWLTVEDNLVPACLYCVDMGDITDVSEAPDGLISEYRYTDFEVLSGYAHVYICK